MREKDIIKQLEALQWIQPDKDWVLLTKKTILERKSIKVRKRTAREILFSPLQKPILVFAFRGAMVAMVALLGAVFYLYHLSSQESSAPTVVVQTNSEYNESVTQALEQVQENLVQIRQSLDAIKKSKDRKQALMMSEVVRGTAQRGKEMVQEMKKKNSSSPKKILASLTEIENEFDSLTSTTISLQHEMIADALTDLSGRSLSRENAERLIKAQQYFRNGQDNEAMLLIIKIMDSRN